MPNILQSAFMNTWHPPECESHLGTTLCPPVVQSQLGGSRVFMTTLFEALDFNNLAIGAVIGAVVGFFSMAGGSGCGKVDLHVKRLALQVSDLQKKLDALLKHQGIEMPSPTSDLSPELQVMAKEPNQKIAAIRHYRQEHPGVGLAEAKERIEEFSKTGR